MAWTNEQIRAEISALEFLYSIPAGEYLTIVKRESKDFEFNGRVHPDGVSMGLAGITQDAITEYEERTGNSFPDYLDPLANLRVGAWYYGARIPQMLAHYGKPNTWQNRLISYNAGIGYVVNETAVEDLPTYTQNYLDYFSNQMKSRPKYIDYVSYVLSFLMAKVFISGTFLN